MTRKTLAVAVLVAALGAISVVAQGQGRAGGFGAGPQGRGRGPGGPGHPGAPNLIALAHQLDLSDTQREQLRQIMEEERKTGSDSAVRDAERKLHEAVFADAPDSAAIDTLKAALNSAHAAELDRHVGVMLKVAQILTPAQRQQLLKLRPEGPPRRH